MSCTPLARGKGFFFERFFSGTRTAHSERTMTSARNDMTTLKPKSGQRPMPTMRVLKAHNSTTDGLRSPAWAEQVDSHQIPFSSEQVRALAVKKKTIPCIHQSPVHFLMVIR